ncbi:MAG: PhoX family phosphatase [Piscinibacter sp.]|uniref:PhoX family protein n=1 Tax=Piscinibacter sp. TaxID=1903157 RepID=UPI00258BE979|nr:PhoX family phosphatase [Piscinibacter sp.]MCW5662594.1 PhoX family phosphatase [Piscinibacter sp.]
MHDDDIDLNSSANPRFNEVLDARLSRRGLLRGGVGGVAGAVLGCLPLAGCGGGEAVAAESATPTGADKQAQHIGPGRGEKLLSFPAVPKSVEDLVTVPEGYTATVLFALGDPLDATTPAYRNDGSDAAMERRAGDHHDGMAYFGLDPAGRLRDRLGAARGLLAINHEATSQGGGELASAFVHVNGGTNTLPRPAAEIDKEVPLHGISIVEVRAKRRRFEVVPGSRHNRRITPLTPFEISGPARGHALMVTAWSSDGTATRGTLNNCGNGETPWGTYLSGEENWAGYFTRGAADNAARTAAGDAKSVTSLNRYGRSQGAASRHGWESGGAGEPYARWDLSVKGAGAAQDYRNELNGFGWIVEVDPYDQRAALKKRTALGRFAHESAAFGLVKEGRPLAVYMGDDSRGEYIYKFVSTATWRERDAWRRDSIAVGDKYLDHGRLYVARFNADGSGDWIELDIANPAIAGYAGYAFADQADVLVNARLAADAVGATKMDRPEWCAVHPRTGEIYYTLTNNSNRKVQPSSSSQSVVDAANPRSYSDSFAGGPAGSPGNVNGHIIRMAEADGRGDAVSFKWDVYLFGAQADADPATINLSSLTDDQDFSSPDGLWFSPSTGLAWIQTDDGAYTDRTNCMMLAGIPGRVGDGQSVRLSYTKSDGTTLDVDTYVGKKPEAGTLKRFLVGPKDCEITGLCETPDGRALFVNIQHPGETIRSADVGDPSKFLSHWPGNAGYGAGGATARPRSATIVITKDDGGRIGT